MSEALDCVISKAPNVFPLVGGHKVEHLRLTDAQVEYLESVRPFDLGFPHNFMPLDPNVTGKPALIGRMNAM